MKLFKDIEEGRTDTNNEIKSIDDDIKDTNDYIIAIKKKLTKKEVILVI